MHEGNSGYRTKYLTKRKRGEAIGFPPFFMPATSQREARTLLHFAATGMTCVGISTDALFIPAPAPESGNNR